MNNFQTELYNFFSTDDNFDVACDVVEHFTTIKKQMTKEFWQDVRNQIKHEMSQFTGWKVYIADDVFMKDSKLCVYRDEFCKEKDVADLSICIEKLGSDPHYGIWVNVHRKDEEMKRIRAELITRKRDWRSDGQDSFWPVWKHTTMDFDLMQTVRQLQPEKRKELVSQMVEKFMELFNFIKADLENMFLVKT